MNKRTALNKLHGFTKPLGFTLVELLVCMAIISILAAITFPALAQARKSAYKIKCMSNLHQIGLAFRMYLDESNGVFPVQYTENGQKPSNVSSTTKLFGWYEAIKLYCTSATDSNNKDIFYCPMNNLSVFEYDGKFFPNLKTSYNANARIEDSPPSEQGCGGHCEDDIINPGSFIMIADSPTINSLRWFNFDPIMGHYMGYNHAGRANCLMFDGRVQSLKSEEITPINITCNGAWPDFY